MYLQVKLSLLPFFLEAFYIMWFILQEPGIILFIFYCNYSELFSFFQLIQPI